MHTFKVIILLFKLFIFIWNLNISNEENKFKTFLNKILALKNG